MSQLDDLIAKKSSEHAREAKAKRGADLSYTVEDDVHLVTWHTQNGYEFLANTPDSNLALWHATFSEEDAPAQAEHILRLARARGLTIYNDLAPWRRAMPASLVPTLAALAALAGVAIYYALASSERSHHRSPRETDAISPVA